MVKQKNVLFNPGDDLIETDTMAHVGEIIRFRAPHSCGISVHDAEVRTNIWCEINFVDYEQWRLGNAWAALARNLIAFGDIDNVDMTCLLYTSPSPRD